MVENYRYSDTKCGINSLNDETSKMELVLVLLKAKSMGLARAVTPNKLNLLNLNALVLLIDVNYFISLFSQNNQENKSPFLLCFAPD